MRWAGHVARMGEKRNACRVLAGGWNLKDRDQWKDLGVHRRIILEVRWKGVDWVYLLRIDRIDGLLCTQY